MNVIIQIKGARTKAVCAVKVNNSDAVNRLRGLIDSQCIAEVASAERLRSPVADDALIISSNIVKFNDAC